MLQSAQREYKDYKGLIVYQKALENTIALFKYYKIHKPLWIERFVIEQLLRSSASIGANIVEGYGRNNKGDYGRFLTIARVSHLPVNKVHCHSGKRSASRIRSWTSQDDAGKEELRNS